MRLALVLKASSNELNSLPTLLLLGRSNSKKVPKASGSQPKSNPKTNRILPAKGANKLPVEDLPRMNKSQASIMAPPVRTNDQILLRIRWVQTGYLKFSAKGTKREVFGMPIPGCSKHMTGDRSRLLNFVKKFIRTVRFGNDHFGAIMGYGDYVVGEASSPGTPQQNGVVERRNRTLVEAARTMLIFSKALMFLWAEAVATAVFGALCYPTNDIEDLGKLQPTADTGIFVGYASSRKGLPPGVVAEPYFMEDHNVAPVDNNPFVNVFASEPHSEASSSGDISSTESPYKQLATNALWCLYSSVLSKIELKNFKSAIIEDCWFQAMQDEIHKFDRLQVWELVPQPDCVMIIALKWIYKVKLDEYGDALKNKARLVAKEYR
nr:hypothetical protein [Tanacetum cinerariifolium]